jgi:MFS family permease
MARMSHPLAQRFGRTSLQAGMVVMAAGFVLLAAMVPGATDVTSWTLVPGELLAGMGMGVALPPLFDFILAGVKGHEVGSASGVLNAVQQFGAALGIAVLATTFFAYGYRKWIASAMTSATQATQAAATPATTSRTRRARRRTSRPRRPSCVSISRTIQTMIMRRIATRETDRSTAPMPPG